MVKAVARYRAEEENIVIMEYPSGKFFIHYGYDVKRDIENSIAGRFDTLEEAEKLLMKHRPKAIKLNSMCVNCKAECIGTSETVWNNCIYKEV